MRGQFECDVTWFYFSFDFVRWHARYHFEREGLFKVGRPRSRWKNFGRRSTEGKRVLKIFTDNFYGRHMCISLKLLRHHYHTVLIIYLLSDNKLDHDSNMHTCPTKTVGFFWHLGRLTSVSVRISNKWTDYSSFRSFHRAVLIIAWKEKKIMNSFKAATLILYRGEEGTEQTILLFLQHLILRNTSNYKQCTLTP